VLVSKKNASRKVKHLKIQQDIDNSFKKEYNNAKANYILPVQVITKKLGNASENFWLELPYIFCFPQPIGMK
jgi:hypothetical protein